MPRCCAECGKAVPEEAKFCPECGGKLSAEVTAQQAEKGNCPSCGGPLNLSSDFTNRTCGHCGAEYEVSSGDENLPLDAVLAGQRNAEAPAVSAERVAILRIVRKIRTLEHELEGKREELGKMADGPDDLLCALFFVFGSVAGVVALISSLFAASTTDWRAEKNANIIATVSFLIAFLSITGIIVRFSVLKEAYEKSPEKAARERLKQQVESLEQEIGDLKQQIIDYQFIFANDE
jgi:hypothetical protein